MKRRRARPGRLLAGQVRVTRVTHPARESYLKLPPVTASRTPDLDIDYYFWVISDGRGRLSSSTTGFAPEVRATAGAARTNTTPAEVAAGDSAIAPETGFTAVRDHPRALGPTPATSVSFPNAQLGHDRGPSTPSGPSPMAGPRALRGPLRAGGRSRTFGPGPAGRTALTLLRRPSTTLAPGIELTEVGGPTRRGQLNRPRWTNPRMAATAVLASDALHFYEEGGTGTAPFAILARPPRHVPAAYDNPGPAWPTQPGNAPGGRPTTRRSAPRFAPLCPGFPPPPALGARPLRAWRKPASHSRRKLAWTTGARRGERGPRVTDLTRPPGPS